MKLRSMPTLPITFVTLSLRLIKKRNLDERKNINILSLFSPSRPAKPISLTPTFLMGSCGRRWQSRLVFNEVIVAYVVLQKSFRKLNGKEMNTSLTAASGEQWKRIR